MKRKQSKLLLYFVCVCLLILYIGNKSGYALSESKALEDSYPHEDGEAVYHHSFGTKKIVIWKTKHMDYVKLVTTKWGLLYRVSYVSQILPSASEPNTIKRTWSAHLNAKKRYETIFAVETVNPEIKSIIISNDSIDDVIADDLDVIKSNSICIELPVINGYVASYQELSPQDSTAFIFRGMDKNGNMVSVTR